MAAGKWVPGLTAATPLDDAARRVLTVRLEVVRDYLQLALHEAEKDVEYVHQLRVSTRRAAAAVEIFSLCLPDRVYRKVRRRLRRIRRAAGAARDWDVFLLDLSSWRPSVSNKRQPRMDFLVGYGVARRDAAQDSLATACPSFPFSFDRLLADTVAAVHRPKGDASAQTLGELARPILTSLLKELDQAMAGNLDDYAHLHSVRIIGKRLRYAMEIFVDCFAPPFRDLLYPQVEQMQEILGKANDSQVARERLEDLSAKLAATRPKESKRYRPAVEALLEFHSRRLAEAQEQFDAWRKRWQMSGAEGELLSLVKTKDETTV